VYRAAMVTAVGELAREVDAVRASAGFRVSATYLAWQGASGEAVAQSMTRVQRAAKKILVASRARRRR
jgi:hypothetical protein